MATATTSGPQQQVAMPAIDLRRFVGSIVASEGVNSAADLVVAQRSAGANMSVDVAAGSAVIKDDHVSGGGYYHAAWSAVENVTIGAAHATLPRVDRIVVRVRDAALGDAANAIDLFVVAGTATSGATLANLTGATAVPGSSLLLANVLVGAAVSSITTANIGNVAPVLQTVGANPPGMMAAYAGASAPLGWLLCDGSAVSRTTNAALFAAIGTAYGTGDGSTTFNVPDFRGRGPVGKGTHADVDTLGDNEGVATVANRSPKHNSSFSLNAQVTGYDNETFTGNIAEGAGTLVGTHPMAVTGTIGPGGTLPVDTHAFLVVNYIIKT